MGTLVNGRSTNIINIFIALVVTALNVVLLYDQGMFVKQQKTWLTYHVLRVRYSVLRRTMLQCLRYFRI